MCWHRRSSGTSRYSSTPSPNSAPPRSALDGAEVVIRAEATREPRDGDPAIAIEMLTSGTTGPAKRVPLGRRQLEASLAAALRHNNRPEVTDKPPLTGAVAMVTLPIVHIGGLWALLQSLVAAPPDRDAGAVLAARVARTRSRNTSRSWPDCRRPRSARCSTPTSRERIWPACAPSTPVPRPSIRCWWTRSWSATAFRSSSPTARPSSQAPSPAGR